MKIVVDILRKYYEDFKLQLPALNKEVPSEFAKYAIATGTPLPKWHGRLIDADAFERRCMFDSDIEDMQDVIYALRDYKSIIEADKSESEDGNDGNERMD